MNNKELLEMAAKAAGITIVDWYGSEHDGFWAEYEPRQTNDVGWNPLTDDGDALRLALRLSLLVMPYPLDSAVRVTRLDQKDTIVFYGEPADPYAATRRAIVRAAAEIGKAMP